ncbi:hypothetical protein NHX12_006179 [Muraenolepis orangiensis]|uniref:Syndecan n=1 Tax=Muraenolepis orangiensis TaxID=630683 RepID=A0A9Q0ICV0_9TELE|nr:hypothetical protein NHX12_006179 [Muraenolepis orangiensis]
MDMYFKITTALLLLIQAFHPTLLQDTTDSPRRTIDPSWLRELNIKPFGNQNQTTVEPMSGDGEADRASTDDDMPGDSPRRTIDPSWLRELNSKPLGNQNQTTVEPMSGDREADMASTDDDMPGSLRGSMALSSGEDEENQERDFNGTSGDGMTVITTPMLFPRDLDTERNASSGVTAAAPETEATQPLDPNPGVNNVSNTEDEFQDSPMVPANHTDQMTPNLTHSSNATDPQEITLAPETHKFNESSGETEVPDHRLENWLSSNSTGQTTSGQPNMLNTTAVPEDSGEPGTPLPTGRATEAPLPETTGDQRVAVPGTTAAVPGTTAVVPGTTAIVPGTTAVFPGTTTVVPETTEESNADKGAVSGGSNAERGTAVAVCALALVIYVILKKKNQKDFSHRKLVEFASDPVLRLDNSEPMDLNYSNGGYSNPGHQMDDFQMTNMP